MPQEESKRGAHFAKGPTLSASSPELASVEQEIRKAWSAATDPGETAVYLRAAGAGSVPSRSPLSSTRPDETAVFWPLLVQAWIGRPALWIRLMPRVPMRLRCF